MKKEHNVWVEKYRPHTVDACILPDRIKQVFKNFVAEKNVPHLLLYGPPGAGKTTIAKAMCEELNCDHIFIAGSEDNGIDVLRTTIRSYASTVSLKGGNKVIIIDEADYLNANSLQPALRTAIEEFSRNCTFVFTCNNKKRLIKPMLSRFAEIDFKLKANERSQMAATFMERIESVLRQEKIDYDQKVLIEIIKKYFPDFRKTINELQYYSILSNGKIDEGLLTHIVDANLKDLFPCLKEKNYANVRKWVHKNTDNDVLGIYKALYEQIGPYIKPSSLPSVILILAKYEYQTAFAMDQEIQLLACLTELMVECEWV